MKRSTRQLALELRPAPRRGGSREGAGRRRALAYVLLDVRKHWRQRHGVEPPVRIDEASSGRWFDGWRREPRGGEETGAGAGPREVARPRTWLLAVGWRRHGLIDPAEVPGG